jgi:hypothetical protein
VKVVPLGGVIGAVVVGCAAVFGIFQIVDHWLNRRP